MYSNACVCVCVCVVRESERERELCIDTPTRVHMYTRICLQTIPVQNISDTYIHGFGQIEVETASIVPVENMDLKFFQKLELKVSFVSI